LFDWVSRNDFQTNVSTHTPKGFKIGGVHFIMQGFGFDLYTNLISNEGIKLENVVALFRYAGKSIALRTGIRGVITPASGCEISAIG